MLTIVGRSSSHFTRIVRIFALELELEHALRVVPNLLSEQASDYGGNPALRIPSLETAHGTWFGSLHACRELSRLSLRKPNIVWPEDLTEPLLANAQELTVQAMATEVGLIMTQLSDVPADNKHVAKQRESLLGSLAWLESNVIEALTLLPPGRDLSYLEVALCCLMSHLVFRDVVPTDPYTELQRFCERWGNRQSVRQTTFRFDAPT